MVGTNRQGATHFLDPVGPVGQATFARCLHVEASSVIANTGGDAPLVGVQIDQYGMSRGMLGGVLQSFHAAEVQGEFHLG